ncbi:MAG: hypothetical protein HPY55_07725 [Firmicutes bacterium]|nr:hypothetical protein [Bacillota bacterium]
MRIAERAGLVKLRHVAVDGTKLKANASEHSAMSYRRMKKEEGHLKKEIEEYLRECDNTNAAEDKKYGKESDKGKGTPPEGGSPPVDGCHDNQLRVRRLKKPGSQPCAGGFSDGALRTTSGTTMSRAPATATPLPAS